MSKSADVIIVGAGMAGVSAGYALAHDGAAVMLLERESQPGYHSTGRSAALFSEIYGPASIRKLSTASRDFLSNPPGESFGSSVLSPRGEISLGSAEKASQVEALLREGHAKGVRVFTLDEAQIREAVPILRPGLFVVGAFEPGAMDIDVHSLHQGFVRGLRRAGAVLVTGAEVVHASRRAGSWHLRGARGERWTAPVVVNAAGAWADVFASLAGVSTIGLTPRRRTALTLDLPPELDAHAWPLAGDIDESFYFKPDAGRLLLSPGDATPVEPQDVQAEDLDVALAIDRFEHATTLTVERPASAWAGLRSFVDDGEPVVGYASDAEGFFWLAGQGGYGIQTAPAMGQACSILVGRQPWPRVWSGLGLSAHALSPARISGKA